jgi:hypothetical protein
METGVIILIMLIHWIADFVFQSDSMATKKSKNFKWLSHHCFLYGVTTAILWGMFFNYNIFAVILAVGLPHLGIDYITSKITSYYYSKGNYHRFFTVIGFDQWLHLITLIGAYFLLAQ